MGKRKRDSRKDTTGSGSITPGWLPSLLGGFLMGLLVPVLVQVLVSTLVLNRSPIDTSKIVLDDDAQQGARSVRWEYEAQPERRFLFGKSKLVVCSAHFEASSEASTSAGFLDLSGTRGLKMRLRSSNEPCDISEVNLFTGPEPVQYVYKGSPVQIGTKWTEVTLDFRDFSLAAWDRRPQRPDGPMLTKVFAFGLDMKTESEPVQGKIWIDDVRVVGHDGIERLITDCEATTTDFGNREVRWRARSEVHGR